MSDSSHFSELLNTWAPPVSFFFMVVFQKMGEPIFRTSFYEVSGLSWSFDVSETLGGEGKSQPMPDKMKFSRLVLKRPIGILDDPLKQWIEDSQGYLYHYGKNGLRIIKTYDVVIYLLDKVSIVRAAWQCSNAYLAKWSLGNFDSDKSGLALETIELVYSRMDRVY